MNRRQAHRDEVLDFLHVTFPGQGWSLTLPQGSGHETYFAHAAGRELFIKLGGHPERTRVMSRLGLTPPLLAEGLLRGRIPITVQPRIDGYTPSARDLENNLERVALVVRKMHYDEQLKSVLGPSPTTSYEEMGVSALAALRRRWESIREQVPSESAFVDDALDEIEGRFQQFTGSEPVASHNDICNANWIFTPDGLVYLVDLDMMSLEDPACDLGAILWWYYPPQMRGRFLEIATPVEDHTLALRMRTRMAMHCLSITLPREGSFDSFDPGSYNQALTDFRAALSGKENPQGYG